MPTFKKEFSNQFHLKKLESADQTRPKADEGPDKDQSGNKLNSKQKITREKPTQMKLDLEKYQ